MKWPDEGRKDLYAQIFPSLVSALRVRCLFVMRLITVYRFRLPLSLSSLPLQ